MFTGYVGQHAIEIRFIVAVYQTIVENARGFVTEKAEHYELIADNPGIGTEDSLNYFAQITKVENVVRFGWSWQKVLFDLAVNFDRSLNGSYKKWRILIANLENWKFLFQNIKHLVEFF